MSSRRWAFLAMTLISAVSFLVDQVFLSAPDSAVADLSANTAAEGAPASTRKNKAAPAANATPPVPELADPSLEYLDKLPKLSLRRDIFSPSPEMLEYYKQLEKQETHAGAAAGPKPGSPQAFEKEYQLQATFNSPEGAMAVINGKMLRVGQEIAGFRLTRIGPYHAEFQRNQERVQLYIPRPDAPRTDKSAPAPAPQPVPEEAFEQAPEQ